MSINFNLTCKTKMKRRNLTPEFVSKKLEYWLHFKLSQICFECKIKVNTHSNLQHPWILWWTSKRANNTYLLTQESKFGEKRMKNKMPLLNKKVLKISLKSYVTATSIRTFYQNDVNYHWLTLPNGRKMSFYCNPHIVTFNVSSEMNE